jgi:hypothetical protein
MSEIALARMQVDLETVRLAELYRSHPLLKSFPVPHLRLPEVEIDIPVLIDESEVPRPDETPRGGVGQPEMRAKFDEVLRARIARAGVHLTNAEQGRLREALDARDEVLRGVPETSVDIGRVADDLSATAAEVLKTRKRRRAGESDIDPGFEADLNESARLEFLKMRKPPPRLNALVTSAEIGNAPSRESVTHLRVKLSEQGVEWTRIEADGGERDQLVPE